MCNVLKSKCQKPTWLKVLKWRKKNPTRIQKLYNTYHILRLPHEGVIIEPNEIKLSIKIKLQTIKVMNGILADTLHLQIPYTCRSVKLVFSKVCIFSPIRVKTLEKLLPNFFTFPAILKNPFMIHAVFLCWQRRSNYWENMFLKSPCTQGHSVCHCI